MQARVLQPFLLGITALAVASLILSYNRLLRSVESAATAAGLIDRA
jgi:hypothetical protein